MRKASSWARIDAEHGAMWRKKLRPYNLSLFFRFGARSVLRFFFFLFFSARYFFFILFFPRAGPFQRGPLL